MRRALVLAVTLAFAAPGGAWADGMPSERERTGDLRPAKISKKKQAKKTAKKTKKKTKKTRRRGRAQMPSFDVTTTAAWRYGQLTPQACLHEIRARELPFTVEDTPGVLAGGRLTGALRGVTYRTRQSADKRATSRWEIADCRLVLALDDLAELLAAHGVVEVIHYSMHRAVPRGWPEGKLGSQHHGALAIDAAIFTRRDGTRLDVLDDWHGRIGAKTCGPDARPRKRTDEALALRAILCEIAAKRLFNVILTPNHDRAHKNHFHLDITPGARWFIVD